MWAFALAADALLRRGLDPLDGSLLRDELLRTSFDGASGDVRFDPTTQDREAPHVLWNAQTHDAAGGLGTEIVRAPVGRPQRLRSPHGVRGGGTYAAARTARARRGLRVHARGPEEEGAGEGALRLVRPATG